MVPGKLTTSMPNIFKDIGIDQQDIKWYHLGACNNMPINWFYDDYESDKELAKQIDQVCIHCPVVKQCLADGLDTKEFAGVRGGIYLNIGRIDKQHNSHKDPDTWKQLKKIHGKDIIHN